MRLLSLGFLLFLSTLTAAAQPTISIRLNPPFEQDAQLRSTWTAVFTNKTNEPLENVPYYFSIAPSSFVTVPEDCVVRFAETTDCTIDLPAAGSREVTFVTRNLIPRGHFSAVIGASLHGAVVFDEAVIGREFSVTTKADAGPGSLRQAIADVNASCDLQTPCVISFPHRRAVDRGWAVLHHAPFAAAGDQRARRVRRRRRADPAQGQLAEPAADRH